MKNTDYESFVEKFKPKKTTDDCYTPPIIYDALVEWVEKQYSVDRSCFVRPFYPGGDYENFDYKGKIVVDNPPFSILNKIIKFYVNNNIKFFLFAPTLQSLMEMSNYCTSICCGVSITYENGAKVDTSFVTNLDDSKIRIRTYSSLYKVIKEAESINNPVRHLPKYKYPEYIVTTYLLRSLNKTDCDVAIPYDDSKFIKTLDCQVKSKRQIYGGGIIVSERIKDEIEKLKLKVKEEDERIEWTLSDREKEIIKELSEHNKSE